MESSQITLTQFLPLIIFYMSIVHLPKLRINIGTLLLTKLQTLFGFNHFPLISSFCSGMQSRVPHCFCCHLSPVSPGLRQFLSLSLFSITLTVLRSTDQVFCKISLDLDLPDVSHMIRLEVWVCGKKSLEVKCFSPHHIRGHMTPTRHHW